MSFVMEESVFQRPIGGRAVLRGQLEQVLLIGYKRNVEIQVSPPESVIRANCTHYGTLFGRDQALCAHCCRSADSAARTEVLIEGDGPAAAPRTFRR